MKKLISILLILLPILSCSEGEKKNGKEFFVFEPDIRLFISYAFMNAAGFNHDWNDTMHPIRLEVRNYLDEVATDEVIVYDVHQEQSVTTLFVQESDRFFVSANGFAFFVIGWFVDRCPFV